jgi:hypothetical protein
MQELTPEAPEAAEGAPEPEGEVVEKFAGGEAATTSPGVALEVAIRSPEIQDAEPIRSAPMTEATSSSRDGIELLADDLVEPAVVAQHLEAIRRAEQWMKVRSRSLPSSQSFALSTLLDLSLSCVGRRGAIPREVEPAARLRRHRAPSRGPGGAAREVAEACGRIQSKLDAAFAKYHNDVLELQAKGDELVRKNKGLRNKNKGMSLDWAAWSGGAGRSPRHQQCRPRHRKRRCRRG